MGFMVRDLKWVDPYDNDRSNLFYKAMISLKYKRRRLDTRENTREKTQLFSSPTVPLFAMQRSKGVRRLRANAG
jgi:hypothetical protein